MSLTPSQVRFFRHNGFLILPTRLSDTHTAELRDAIFSDIKNEVEPVVRAKGAPVRISDVWSRGGVYERTIRSDELLDPLASLLGPNIEFIRNRHNHATLRLQDDGSAYLHRDVLQWSRTIVTVLIYLEDSTMENGCTRVIPGTHVLEPGMTSPSHDGVDRVAEAGLAGQMVPVPMPAGGLLAIDSMIFHGVGPNSTDSSRTSMTVGYHSMDELTDGQSDKRVLVRGERLYQGNDGR
jgi:phytanoyl-CoA hydroxylase